MGRSAPDVHDGDARGTLAPLEGERRLLTQEERGDIISSWLIQLVIFMSVVGFFGYEFLAMATTALTLDGQADQVANIAADAYEDRQDLDEAIAAAQVAADERDVELISVTVDDRVIFITIRGTADTLLSHHIGPLDRFVHPSVTRRERWRP